VQAEYNQTTKQF